MNHPKCPFGKEATRDEYLERAAWEAEQSKMLESKGQRELAEAHANASNAYRNAAYRIPVPADAPRAPRSRAETAQIGDWVRFPWCGGEAEGEVIEMNRVYAGVHSRKRGEFPMGSIPIRDLVVVRKREGRGRCGA